MDNTYWYKQTTDNPLYPDLLWNRPENRMHAGKLLIIGGSAAGFRAPADAYRYAITAGIGTTRILLPDSLRKTVGEVFLELGEYAPSTPSGSFSYKAFAELLMQSNWSDGVLLAGDFGRNSETAQLLEYYINKYHGQITITGDALDYFLDTPRPLLQKENVLLAPTIMQMQKLAAAAQTTMPFMNSLSMQAFVETLHMFQTTHACSVIITYNGQAFVASQQKISSIPTKKTELALAVSASVWYLQNPEQSFQAFTTSLV